MSVLEDEIAANQYLAPEMLLDKANPANDPYFASLERLRTLAAMVASQLKPAHVEIVRRHHRAERAADIAEALNLSVQTVYAALKRPKAVELLRLLQHIGALIDGPNLAVRKNMLWRIAASNETEEPNVAIAAVKELNKLDGAYPVQSQQAAPQVNITINQDVLPRTALDDLPETMS